MLVVAAVAVVVVVVVVVVVLVVVAVSAGTLQVLQSWWVQGWKVEAVVVRRCMRRHAKGAL